MGISSVPDLSIVSLSIFKLSLSDISLAEGLLVGSVASIRSMSLAWGQREVYCQVVNIFLHGCHKMCWVACVETVTL